MYIMLIAFDRDEHSIAAYRIMYVACEMEEIICFEVQISLTLSFYQI